jgi:hypothetical protein
VEALLIFYSANGLFGRFWPASISKSRLRPGLVQLRLCGGS